MLSQISRWMLALTTPLMLMPLISAPCNANVQNQMTRAEELHRCLYQIYRTQKHYPEAEKEVAAVSKLAPRDAKIQGEFGRTLFDDKLFKDAYPHLIRATEIDPDLAVYWANRGACEVQLKRFKEAIESFKKAVQHQRGSERYDQQLQQLQQWYSNQQEIERQKQLRDQPRDHDE